MNFHCLDVQGKGRMLAETLHAAGHKHVQPPLADLLLIDIDDPDAPRRGRLIDQCRGKVILYPHGALPTYHGFYEPDDRIDVQIVHGPGAVESINGLELDRDVVDVGWSYSPFVPFTKVKFPQRVLFGPIHPYGSGQLHDQDKNLNARVYATLKDAGLNLAVQMYGSHVNNGLPAGLSVYRSTLMLDWAAVDHADLVVAEGTLACLALARGKPVIMFGQDAEPTDEHNRPRRGPVIKVPRYPIDIDDGDLHDLIDAACNGKGEAWRKQFVGGPFDAGAFLNAAEITVAMVSS